MSTFVEENLQIVFPRGTEVERFYDPESHGFSHCMKAVDFIVEDVDQILFIELKDPENPRAREANRRTFASEFLSGNLDEDLKYKYRDTFLYRWASDGFDKPISYWVIIAIETLTAVDLDTRTDALRRKLPLRGPPSAAWRRPIVSDCIVCNIETWNRHQPRFPLWRIP